MRVEPICRDSVPTKLLRWLLEHDIEVALTVLIVLAALGAWIWLWL